MIGLVKYSHKMLEKTNASFLSKYSTSISKQVTVTVECRPDTVDETCIYIYLSLSLLKFSSSPSLELIYFLFLN